MERKGLELAEHWDSGKDQKLSRWTDFGWKIRCVVNRTLGMGFNFIEAGFPYLQIGGTSRNP